MDIRSENNYLLIQEQLFEKGKKDLIDHIVGKQCKLTTEFFSLPEASEFAEYEGIELTISKAVYVEGTGIGVHLYENHELISPVYIYVKNIELI